MPTTAARAYATPSVQGKVFYLDDRDYVDEDDNDGQAGGIWLYEETNGYPGLQRGGLQWVFTTPPVSSVTLPYFEERKVPVPGAGPVPPRELTLFRGGLGGGNPGSSNGVISFADDCYDRQPNGAPYPSQDRIWM